MTRRHWSPLLKAAVCLGLLWAAGFAWFLHAAGSGAERPPARADGIVALTGGAGRVEAALRLLADGRARVALISGVGGAADFGDLARRAGVDRGLAARVTLGRAAESTRGNAAETAAWARAQGIRSLIVVTAAYHMPRALAELARALPGTTLIAHPVVPPAMDPGDAGTLRMLAQEYTKWLAAEIGLTAFEPHTLAGQDRGTAPERGG